MSNNPAITVKQQLKWVLLLSLVMLTLQLVNMLSAYSLNNYGLIPRNQSGLIGVITAPFLHGSWWHFFSNIIPFVLFSFLLLQHGLGRYIRVSLGCILGTGLLVWFFARDAVHVGASGLIYGYFGYLLLAGLLSKRLKLTLISLFIGFSYGGLIFGVLPMGRYISWESHLAGLCCGLFLAYYYRGKN